METLGNKKVLKKSIKYICDMCNYSTSNKQNYDKHILTRKHNIATLGNPEVIEKSIKKYVCDFCYYSTSNKQNYEKHILTRRHKMETLGNQKVSKSIKNYICEFCNKKYTNRSGLWKHKQICNKNIKVYIPVNNIPVNNEEKEPNITSSNSQIINVVLELVKQNTEFKDLLVEQNKYIIEQNKQNGNLQSQFIELAKEKTMSNCLNNMTNNNTTNNNHFNLQFFLNETCKNAMNITDFIEQINISLSDLENTGRLGYAEGITRIFVNGLKELDINQRPIHCSDGKRETLYIKDGNVWEKDDINKSKLTNAIKKVAHKNMRKITDWVTVHPNCKDSESNKNDLYLKIVSNSMSGITDEEAEYNYDKIKRNIIKEVVINK
jgi:hypothetical protein